MRSVEVDISLLPAMSDIDQIVRQICAIRSPGARFTVFFAALGFGGLRPSEAAALLVTDIELPASGWGVARLRESVPSPGTKFTDNGSTRQLKELKHRPVRSVRPVPIPPILVGWFALHIERWPNIDGAVFTNNAGRSITPENYGKVWNREKSKLWTLSSSLVYRFRKLLDGWATRLRCCFVFTPVCLPTIRTDPISSWIENSLIKTSSSTTQMSTWGRRSSSWLVEEEEEGGGAEYVDGRKMDSNRAWRRPRVCLPLNFYSLS